MAANGAVAVAGGNWQIFAHMVKNSSASIKHQCSVESISLEGSNMEDPHAKYILATSDASPGSKVAAENYPIYFDNVVIATPWQFSGIEASEGVLRHKIEENPYVQLHVTLFASPYVLSPAFFNITDGTPAPETILTTLGPDDTPGLGSEAAGKAGFFSISTLREITNPETGKTEFLYKIFSPQKVEPSFLEALLGAKVPETFTGSDGDISDATISWYHAHVFNSYPIELPRIDFQDTILRRGLYYTSGIESFISTMETSSLMGKNVARLIVDDIAGHGDGQGAERDGRDMGSSSYVIGNGEL
jgi:prenylcysteine oxidase/farnesylcysteine lyase